MIILSGYRVNRFLGKIAISASGRFRAIGGSNVSIQIPLNCPGISREDRLEGEGLAPCFYRSKALPHKLYMVNSLQYLLSESVTAPYHCDVCSPLCQYQLGGEGLHVIIWCLQVGAGRGSDWYFEGRVLGIVQHPFL